MIFESLPSQLIVGTESVMRREKNLRKRGYTYFTLTQEIRGVHKSANPSIGTGGFYSFQNILDGTRIGHDIRVTAVAAHRWHRERNVT